MKTWKQLMVRYGFDVVEQKKDVFSWEKERKENIQFACDALHRLDVKYSLEGEWMVISQTPVSEKAWAETLEVPGRGRTEIVAGNPTLEEMDTHISGLVMQMNRLGLKTVYSCDGHGRRPAHLDFIDQETVEKAAQLLEVVFEKRVRITRSGIKINAELSELVDCAEAMSEMDSVEDTDKILQFFEEKERNRFEEKLEELLMIPGVSQNEGRVRSFVKQEIAPHVDDMVVDEYGNLLARKVCGHGRGPVVLLNAHLDVFDEMVAGRSILKNGSTWTSDEGILGADDRAGIAIILEVLRHAGSHFDGTLKIAFTVEEEIGLQGSRHVNPVFLWGVDAAFVLDRRGTGDVVVRGGGMDFCSKHFGSWVKEIAGSGWSCVRGGSSDARIWAEAGIETVNLSVGYRHEHTEEETLDVDACYETARVMRRVLENHRSLKRLVNRRVRARA
ncbi:M20/M25/M40 family metallo-hydrolase [Salimicrobium halophilum]|uniref:M42 glutamyl aminopeptidase n=1 Tax=Salimicrobium halophilum TaxID=86666 RepID=A0A1G8T8V1_9BACI|nr:M20/M25/M40 family metallo-hydrolase [Salimicrobium halophilum]SDJ37817.1 M42 glutamyl aminopeptidase [Salimicrobium halophilum]